jgi:uncharacterized protein (TIGR02145 family)
MAMKKLLVLPFIASIFFIGCISEYCPFEPINPLTLTDEGIVINGIRWATRNVDAPGTFTEEIDCFGRLYTWHEAQNACPQGWRVPSIEELESLNSVGSFWRDELYLWLDLDAVSGRYYGGFFNRVFLPASGWLNFNLEALINQWAEGYYWSSTPHENPNAARALSFDDSKSTVTGSYHRTYGFAVRCVFEND